MKRLDTTKKFDKQYAKLPENIKTRFKQRSALLLKDQLTPELNDHSLKGKFVGYRSINITGDYRALYYESGNLIIIFAFIGTHSQLYG